MIVGEARTDAEATEFAQVAKRALDARGYPNTISPKRVKDTLRGGHATYPAVWEDGKIVAVGAVSWYSGTRGFGAWVDLFMPAMDYPDPNLALDTLALYYLNVLAAQGRYAIKATLPDGFSPDYYTKMLGMEVEYTGTDTVTGAKSITFWGTTKGIMQAILRRRREWRIL